MKKGRGLDILQIHEAIREAVARALRDLPWVHIQARRFDDRRPWEEIEDWVRPLRFLNEEAMTDWMSATLEAFPDLVEIRYNCGDSMQAHYYRRDQGEGSAG